MKRDRLEQMLYQAAAREYVESRNARLPEGCPSMARMYTAVLRDDWTEAERACLKKSPEAQELLAKVQANVWYPTSLELFQYLLGNLPEDQRADIEYHLKVDHCRRSQILAAWLGYQITKLNEGADAMRRFAQALANSLTFPGKLQPRAISGGFSSEGPGVTPITTDDGQTSATIFRESDHLWLSLESKKLPVGTLLRVILANADGGQEFADFVMLREGFKESAAGNLRLTRNVPEDCMLFCYPVDPLALLPEEASELTDAFKAAQVDDPAAVSLWQSWAATARRNPDLNQRTAVAVALRTIADTTSNLS